MRFTPAYTSLLRPSDWNVPLEALPFFFPPALLPLFFLPAPASKSSSSAAAAPSPSPSSSSGAIDSNCGSAWFCIVQSTHETTPG